MIYLDNAATTKMSEAVVRNMLPFMNRQYANPSGIYEFSEASRHAVDDARSSVAGLISVKPEEIYFTSGGSEADNWALKAVMRDCRDRGRHLVTTKIEHHAVLETCRYLETQGVEVTYVDVDENGFVDLARLERAIRPDTVCISVMAANNEIGTIQPLYEIGQIARKHNVLFHTDAVQAFGHIPIDVHACNIHMLSASAHKLEGPKGVGCLYVSDQINLSSFIHGGGQERKHRAGTENVPGIIGFGIAAGEASGHMLQNTEHEKRLRDYLIRRILKEIPYVRLNGSSKKRLPNNANFSFQFVDGASLLILLDHAGICASAASACSTGSKEPSHVLMALGMPEELAYGTLRLTLGRTNTKDEIDYVINEIKKGVGQLRALSEEYREIN